VTLRERLTAFGGERFVVNDAYKEGAMKSARLFALALLLFPGISVTTTQNSIRLHFDVYRNRTLVSNPDLSVPSGTHGRLEIDGVGTIEFTPTFRTSDSISIQFDMNIGGRRARPVIVIGRNQPGRVSWSSNDRRDEFKFTVNWVR
jgi:hypothetical protein